MNSNSNSKLRCVSPSVAKDKLKDVKINIQGVGANNALDLLMEF